ncbi:MAG: glycosyltransferase family 4 protein [Cyanobacteria bacterium P01_H01_bin.74]
MNQLVDLTPATDSPLQTAAPTEAPKGPAAEKRFKILHFLPDNQAWGGIEFYLKATLSAMAAHPDWGNRFELVAAVTEGGRLAEQLKNSAVTVRLLPVHIKTPLVRVLDYRVLQALLVILKEERPDLVHIHKGRVEQSMIRMAGYPLMMTYHSYGGPNNLENTPNAFLRSLYAATTPLLRGLTPFLETMLVVSDYERQRLYRENFIPKAFEAQVLYNGIPTDDLLKTTAGLDKQAFREALSIPEGARVVSFICRLAPDKNALAFLRIAKAVFEQTSQAVYFLVAGQGPDAQLFEAAFAPGGTLHNAGQYLGFRSDVPKLLAISDFTVSTSCQEGFGLRVLESLLFGCPCLTYAAGGIPEVMSLPEAKDWLIPVGDETQFVAALLQALAIPAAKREALAAVLQAHARTFDSQHHINKLGKIYTNVLSKLQVNNFQA